MTMERTSNMNAEQFAKFIVNVTDDPTKGTILDALDEAGFSDDEALQALQSVKDYTEDPQIDSPEDPDNVIQEGKDKDNVPADGMTLDEFVQDSAPLLDDSSEDDGGETFGDPDLEGDPIPDDEEDDDTETDDHGDEVIPKDPGEPLDDQDVEDNTQTPDSVPLDNDGLVREVAQYTQDNPSSTVEDLTRHLHNMGVPGDKLREFMKGYNQLKSSASIVWSMIMESNVSFTDAASWAAQHTNKKAEEIKQLLLDFGASEREAEEAIAALPASEPLQDPAIGQNAPDPTNPGGDDSAYSKTTKVEALMAEENGERTSPQVNERVMTPKGAARVAHIHESLQGEIYNVVTDEGESLFYGINSLSSNLKTASATEDVWGRIQSHMEENWYSDMDKLPVAAKGGYEKRLAKTQELRKEIEQKIANASADEQGDLLKIAGSLENEEDYIVHKLKNSFTLEDADYLTSRPQFNITAAHSSVGVGVGGSVIHAAALAAEREMASIDWKKEVTAGADLFVVDIHPKYIADAGEVRKQATRYIQTKTASLPEEDAEPLRKQFVANVEKARKAAVIEVRKTASKKEAAPELPANFEEGLFF